MGSRGFWLISCGEGSDAVYALIFELEIRAMTKRGGDRKLNKNARAISTAASTCVPVLPSKSLVPFVRLTELLMPFLPVW
jgi:hypothetical protein